MVARGERSAGLLSGPESRREVLPQNWVKDWG